MEVLYNSSCYIRYIHFNVDLYWTQELCGSSEGVRSLDLTTRQETIIVSGTSDYSDLAVFDGMTYWTGLARVNSVSVAGGGIKNEMLHISNYGPSQSAVMFRGITVVHPQLQQRYIHFAG